MKQITIILLILSLLAAFAGVLIMTDMGQIFGISKEVIVFYFRNNVYIILFSFVALLAAYLINRKHGFFKPKFFIWMGAIWLILVLSTKYVTPYLMFRANQHNAEYLSVSDAKDYLNDDDIVFVVERNGIQRAFPRSYIWQNHIIGGDFAGEEVVMTYCVLTNLPTPFVSDINGNKVDFKVLAQTNNNLLIWDQESGEIIQQITQTCEFSEKRLDPVPVLEMPWKTFKKVFPKGTVYLNEWDTPVEKMMNVLMDTESNWSDDGDWLFETVNFDDTRFPSREMVIGVADPVTNKQVAISKPLIEKEMKINVSVGDKNLVLAYFPEYETIAAFDRNLNGSLIEVEEIDIYGNTPNGKLERAYIYNSLFWGVWVHYYPDTEVIQ